MWIRLPWAWILLAWLSSWGLLIVVIKGLKVYHDHVIRPSTDRAFSQFFLVKYLIHRFFYFDWTSSFFDNSWLRLFFWYYKLYSLSILFVITALSKDLNLRSFFRFYSSYFSSWNQGSCRASYAVGLSF